MMEVHELFNATYPYYYPPVIIRTLLEISNVKLKIAYMYTNSAFRHEFLINVFSAMARKENFSRTIVRN